MKTPEADPRDPLTLDGAVEAPAVALVPAPTTVAPREPVIATERLRQPLTAILNALTLRVAPADAAIAEHGRKGFRQLMSMILAAEAAAGRGVARDLAAEAAAISDGNENRNGNGNSHSIAGD